MQKIVLPIYFAIFSSLMTLAGLQHSNAQIDEAILPITPTIQITSHADGEQVSAGEMAIEGNSSDTEETDCQVYADVNDIPPLQNATAEGEGGEGDFSQWSFEYTAEYELIKDGENELTAKISCFDNGPIPVSEWHTINVTGIGDGQINTNILTDSPLAGGPSTLTLPTIESGEGNSDVVEEEEGEGDDEGEDEGESP